MRRLLAACAPLKTRPPVAGPGERVVAGFHDAHLHLLDGGLSLSRALLGPARTEAEAVDIVRRWAEAHPAGAARGVGWGYDIVPAGTYPTRAALDAAFPERPAVLESYDGHAYWFNTAALRNAGLAEDAPDPEGARFTRRPDGTLDGVVLEADGDLVERLAGPTPRAEKEAALRAGLALLARSGVTAATVMGASPEEFDLLVELEGKGGLPITLYYSPPLEEDLAYAESVRARCRGRLRFGWLKGFVDGVFESKTAAVLAPYPDGTPGSFAIPPERLKALVRAAQARGFAVALHATGDAGVRAALDAYEAARGLPPPARRHRVEHAEVVDPADVPRFKALDVVASMQPLHADPGGAAPEEGAWSRNVGPARMPHSYPWRALKDAGAVLAFGSDWTVVTHDPVPALAFAQRRADGALTFAEALDAYTTGPAYAAREEVRPDDFVVLGADGRVARVFVGGREVRR